MSHIWYAVNDDLKLITAIGQGYDKVNLWYGDEREMECLKTLLTASAQSYTSIRILGEHAGTSESWSDPTYVDPDAKVWDYKKPEPQEQINTPQSKEDVRHD